MERREFLRLSLSAGALALINMAGFGCQPKVSEPLIELPPLPYGASDLEPYISEKTIGFHYGKHHQAYVDKTNASIAGTPYESLPLEEIIKQTQGKDETLFIFNNAAQVFNHTFYWNSMKPKGGGIPTGPVSERITDAFGSHENFFVSFFAAAKSHFGSGWVWLVFDNTTLRIFNTSNADTPIVHGMTPVLALDVWEHAYYLDYQNRKTDYLKDFLEHLVNWEFVAKNLGCYDAPEVKLPDEKIEAHPHGGAAKRESAKVT